MPNKAFSRALVLALFFLSSFSCGGELQDLPDLEGDQTVVIQNYAFTPTRITAQPGETLFFYNGDADPHRILSQSDNDAFDDTGAFDSSVITEGSFGVVTVPEAAVPGDEIPFYDDFFRETMATPNGVVVVE